MKSALLRNVILTGKVMKTVQCKRSVSMTSDKNLEVFTQFYWARLSNDKWSIVLIIPAALSYSYYFLCLIAHNITK